jgi:hypothetical protein
VFESYGVPKTASGSYHPRWLTPQDMFRLQQQQQQQQQLADREPQQQQHDASSPGLHTAAAVAAQQLELAGNADRSHTAAAAAGSPVPNAAAVSEVIAEAGCSADRHEQEAASGFTVAAAAAAGAGSCVSPPALCASISASAKGLEVSSAAWECWLPQVQLQEKAVAKLGLRFQVQQQQGGGGGLVLLPADGPVLVRALKSTDGVVR